MNARLWVRTHVIDDCFPALLHVCAAECTRCDCVCVCECSCGWEHVRCAPRVMSSKKRWLVLALTHPAFRFGPSIYPHTPIGPTGQKARQSNPRRRHSVDVDGDDDHGVDADYDDDGGRPLRPIDLPVGCRGRIHSTAYGRCILDVITYTHNWVSVHYVRPYRRGQRWNATPHTHTHGR